MGSTYSSWVTPGGEQPSQPWPCPCMASPTWAPTCQAHEGLAGPEPPASLNLEGPCPPALRPEVMLASLARCWPASASCTHVHTHRDAHVRTQSHTHMHIHAQTHARAHTHTHVHAHTRAAVGLMHLQSWRAGLGFWVHCVPPVPAGLG